MPYPFAHPAAVLPLARPLGRFAVPSALAIGSIVPDLWYFVPFVSRADSHGGAAFLWFALPVGLLVYVVFHLVLKEPLIALLSPKLGAFTLPGLPARPWYAVVVSLLVGALTHVVWDALTHSNTHDEGVNWIQHANTAAGTAILAIWVWTKLRRVPAKEALVSPFARLCAFLLMAGAAAISALWSADIGVVNDLAAARQLLRTAGIGAVEGFGVALLVYCLLFQRKMLR